MSRFVKYEFNDNGDLIGYQCWDADRKPLPSNDYIDQLPPTEDGGMLATKAGKEKYKKNPNNAKKWDDGSAGGAPKTKTEGGT